MATRTFKTGDDVDAALNFLGKQQKPQIGGDEYLQNRFQILIDDLLVQADNQRFSLIKEMMDDKNKGQSISKLREVLGVG
jgi:hypothetical protein